MNPFPSFHPWEETDFYPGFGQFETETFRVEFQIGKDTFSLRCGTLPDLLGMTLMMADADGIIGNEILRDRKAGLFFRRNRLVLWPPIRAIA